MSVELKGSSVHAFGVVVGSIWKGKRGEMLPLRRHFMAVNRLSSHQGRVGILNLYVSYSYCMTITII